MSEAFNDKQLATDKAQRYRELDAEVASVLAGERNLVARMASLVAMLKLSFPSFFWCGFYVVDPQQPDELVVGPYQGSLGCLRIPFGKGVCGAAAKQRTVQLVPDVHQFPGHIACDGRSKSEVVLPVFDSGGALLGVLDVDGTQVGAFDEVDVAGLERLLRHVAP